LIEAGKGSAAILAEAAAQTPCGQSCGQDVREMCSSDETIHKILGLFGNFVLSRSAIRASILLHVKAPEDGGCGPLQELRFTEMQLEGLELSGSRSGQAVTVSRRLRFPPALVGPAFGLGNMRCGGLRAGDRPGSGISSGVFVAGGDEPLAIRGWAASSGAFRPAPEADLPCRSRLLDGRCPSNFDATLSGDGRSPSPCRGVGQSGTAQLLAKRRLGLSGQGGFPRGASGGPEGSPRKRRLSGDLKTGGVLRAAFWVEGIFRDLSPRPGRALRP